MARLGVERGAWRGGRLEVNGPHQVTRHLHSMPKREKGREVQEGGQVKGEGTVRMGQGRAGTRAAGKEQGQQNIPVPQPHPLDPSSPLPPHPFHR